VRLNALFDADVFLEDDLQLIECNFERHPAAALAMFCSNTTVAFGHRSVDMDTQVHLPPQSNALVLFPWVLTAVHSCMMCWATQLTPPALHTVSLPLSHPRCLFPLSLNVA
jgi:hypothetical protein